MKLKDNLPLFIFEMANNHSGDVEHGINIIRHLKEVCKDYKFNFAVKLQYRDLDTFIHPDYQNRTDIKYIKRFSETRLTEAEFIRLKYEIKNCGFISTCTPFDENSVDKIIDHNYDVIKIGSCSFTDWPLLEKIVTTEKPVIISTAAASLEDIDKVVSFFEHRKKDFAIMHCVGAYPTKREDLQINQIDLLKQKYPGVPVGFSTHEEPDNIDSIKIAVAKGAKIFERHVSIESNYGLNAYSSTPEQLKKWLDSAVDAYKMCGEISGRHAVSEKEKQDLRGLKRGVFASRKITKGEKLTSENTFFAIPNIENQLIANEMSKYSEYIVTKDIEVNEALLSNNFEVKNLRENVLEIIKHLKNILIDSKLPLPNKLEMELSHHYGIEKFQECGAAIFNMFNREYCKKIIVLLPGQAHPVHHHIQKEETFQVLYGDLTVNLDGKLKKLETGELLTVEREVKHSFSSEAGAVFEEISTTHSKNDSFYEDKSVTNNLNRKTQMTFWSDWLFENLK